MQITFYAGAADAVGASTLELEEGGLTATELLERLGAGDEKRSAVLSCCSLLVDGSPVRDRGITIPRTARVDVLPPFAGG